MPHRLAATVAAVITVGAWGLPAARAGASDPPPTVVTCGETLTASVVLANNLHCTGPALILGVLSPAGQPITVDLGGHTVASSSPGTCFGNPPDAGTGTVVVLGPDVTVEHGRISAPVHTSSVCDTGVRAIARHLVIDGGGWVEIHTDNHPTLRDNTFVRGATYSTPENTVDLEDNTFVNGPADESAISGEFLEGTISGNRISGYGAGMRLGDNIASRLVKNNVVVGSGVGILVDGVIGEGDVFTGNWLVRNRGDGLLVETIDALATPPSMIEGNIAVGNGGDGIHINPVAGPPESMSYTVTVARNLAVSNRGYGIEAPASAPPDLTIIDGGGDVAFGNGATPQCLNVACSGP